VLANVPSPNPQQPFPPATTFWVRLSAEKCERLFAELIGFLCQPSITPWMSWYAFVVVVVALALLGAVIIALWLERR
jgi:hypothetical protein